MSNDPSKQLLAIARQADLIAELLKLIRPVSENAAKRVVVLTAELTTLCHAIYVSAQEHCEALLGVGAGLDAILELMELGDDSGMRGHRLHALVTLLRNQLNVATDGLQEML